MHLPDRIQLANSEEGDSLGGFIWGGSLKATVSVKLKLEIVGDNYVEMYDVFFPTEDRATTRVQGGAT